MKKKQRSKKLSKNPTKKNFMFYLSKNKWLVVGVILVIVGTFAYQYSLRVNSLKNMYQESLLDAEVMTPEEVAINLVTGGKVLPKSDDPEVNAMIAAHQVIREEVKNGKSQDDEEVQRKAELVAARAARDTVSAGDAAGVNYSANDPLNQGTVNSNSAFKQVATEAVDTLTKYIQYFSYKDISKGETIVKQIFKPDVKMCVSEDGGDGASGGSHMPYTDVNGAKTDVQCQDGYHLISTKYSQIYSNISNRKDDFDRRFCNSGNFYYPVGSTQVENGRCYICGRRDYPSKDSALTNFEEIDKGNEVCTTMNMSANTQPEEKDNCLIFFENNSYTLEQPSGNNYKEVLFPSTEKEIYLKRADMNNAINGQKCVNGVWE